MTQIKHYKKAIVGAGGFAREVKYQALKSGIYVSDFFVEPQYLPEQQKQPWGIVRPLSEIDPDVHVLIIAIGDPIVRERVIEKLPRGVKFWTFISKDAVLLDDNIEIGEGSIICAGCVLTTNIKIGNHTHINLNTTIGHDVEIGNFVTISPNVSVSGNVSISDYVEIGSNASIREKTSICSNVIIGLNSGVVKNIIEPGVYVGLPTKKIK